MASLLEISDDNKSQTFRNVLIGLVVVVFIGVVSYSVGYFKGASNCKTINVKDARKSLEYSQEASRNTSTFNVDQEKKISDLQQQLMEVQNACLNSTMPDDLINLLNQ